MKPSFPEKYARVQATILAVLLMVLIWLPALDSLFHLDWSSPPNENRALAQFPVFQPGPGSLQQYFAGLESYFNDHFGFRKRLIRWQHKCNHELFRESFRDDVLVGHDDWLFFSGEHVIENIQGLNLFTPDQLNAWQHLLESRRDWCARLGSAYLFVVAPDKHSVYPEKLPDWLQPLKHPNRLDQFIAHMAAHSTVPILDLRPSLLAAKGSESLYLVADMHWNNLGSFIGYQSLVNALTNQLPELKPFRLDAFERKLVPSVGGDLARMLGREQSTVETANWDIAPRPPLKTLTVITDTNLLAGKWLKGITEPTYTTNSEAKLKVIIHHDSFGMYWLPVLGYHFNQVIFIWQNNWDMNFLERQEPDVVIDEMVERFFISKDPAHLTENW